VYRDNPALVRCRGCAVELPLEAAAIGHLCGRCASARFAQRAIVLLLAALLAAPILQCLHVVLTFARVEWWGLPSFAERAALLVVVDLAALALIALAIRAPRRPPGPLSRTQLVAVVALAIASLAGTAGATWLHYEMTLRLNLSPAVLAAWSLETAKLSLAGIALHALGMALLFGWSVWRFSAPAPRA
jgi:hypothetical protein